MTLKELIEKLQALPAEYHSLKVVQPGVDEGGLAPRMYYNILNATPVSIKPCTYKTYRGTYDDEDVPNGTPPNAIVLE